MIKTIHDLEVYKLSYKLAMKLGEDNQMTEARMKESSWEKASR